MVDVTNAPVPTGASPFDVPGDLKKIADHFGDDDMYSVANEAALPASGNWPGRLLMARDTGALYECFATPGNWRVVYRPATAPGSVTANPGSGFTISNNTMFTRDGWLLGSIDWAKTSGTLQHADSILTITSASVVPLNDAPVGGPMSPSPAQVGWVVLVAGSKVVTPLSPPAGRTGGSLRFAVPIQM